MTDDPWKKPDPNAAPDVPPPGYAPPGYGPPPGYGQQPIYGPPGGGAFYDPNNPYGAPLPKRGGIKRLVWILLTAGVLVLGGCGVVVYFVASSLTKNADEVNAFLRNVRDHQFTTAYDQLCPGVRDGESSADFVSHLQAAVDRGHGVTSFDITTTNTNSGTDGSSRSAGGGVNFADGNSSFVTFTLGKTNGKLCISSGYGALG